MIPDTRPAADTRCGMRRGLLVAVSLALLLVVPAIAGAARPEQQQADGCLVVANGSGIVTVVAHGGIFGRFLYGGRVTIEDLSPGGGKAPKVFGAQDVRTISDTKTLYIGTSVRFRFTGGGLFRVVINAVGIDLSVVGRGTATLSSTGLFEPGRYSVDDDSLCAKSFKPMPDTPTRVQVGAGGTG